MTNEQEKALAKALGDIIGYGRLMQLGQELWREDLGSFAGGEFSIGPCVASMVPCPHSVRDTNGHCKICCGSGKTTKWVAENVKPPN